MWSERKQLSMLNRSQQVAEHRATRTCFLASSPLCPPLIFTDLSKKNFSFVTEREVKHMLAQSIPPPSRFLPHTHTHTYIEGEHQQLVFSLCFSRRAALILPDKGWESQENISTHTNTRAEMCHATITHARHTATHLHLC